MTIDDLDDPHDRAVEQRVLLLHQHPDAVLRRLAIGDVSTHHLNLDQAPILVEEGAVDELSPSQLAIAGVYPVLDRDHRVLWRQARQRCFYLWQVRGQDGRLPAVTCQRLARLAEKAAEGRVGVQDGSVGLEPADQVGLRLQHLKVAMLTGLEGQ